MGSKSPGGPKGLTGECISCWAYVLLALIHYACTVNPGLIQVHLFLVIALFVFECSDGCAVNPVEMQVNIQVRLLCWPYLCIFMPSRHNRQCVN